MTLVAIKIKANMNITISVYLSFCAGFILPVFCAANILYLINDLQFYYYKNMDQTIEIDYMGQEKTSEILKRLSNLSAIEESSVTQLVDKVIPSLDNRSYLIMSMDECALAYKTLPIGCGSMFAQGEEQCIISTWMAARCLLNCGDKIIIDNQQYTISGITESRHYEDYIIIPASEFHWQDVTTQNVMYITLKNTVSVDTIRQSMNFLNTQINRIQYGSTAFADIVITLKEWIITRIIVGITGLFFALINNSLLLHGKLQDMQHKFGVYLALGATWKDLFSMFFMEILTINFLSGVTVLLILKPLAAITRLSQEIVINGRLFVINILVILITSLLMSIFLMNRYKKYSINEILTGRI